MQGFLPAVKKNLLVVICGPTAIGKTQLAIDLAVQFNCEVISADSRQLYKELNIGAAKPSSAQLQKVTHHFIGSHHVSDVINAAFYASECLALLQNLFKKKPVQIMVGGTGLYINAVLNGIDELPESNIEIRINLREIFEKYGIQALQKQLKLLDKKTFEKIDLTNPNRIMRAIEVCLITGKPYSALLQHKKAERPFNYIVIGLNDDRKNIYQRINNRVDDMMKQGLLNETETLKQFRNFNALQTVGYKELFDFLDGKCSIEQAIELIKKNTRNYAKRQLTWFRKMENIQWFGPGDNEKIIAEIKKRI